MGLSILILDGESARVAGMVLVPSKIWFAPESLQSQCAGTMKKLLIIAVCLFIGFKVASMLDSTPVGFDPVVELGSELRDSSAQKADSSKLKGKITLLYFSAKWCPPCQQFTPILVKFQKKHRDKVEVVFISSDKSSVEMKAYIKAKRMDNFYCVDFNSPMRGALGKQFKVKGIPSVVVISPSGEVASMNATNQIFRSRELPEEWTR